MKKRSVLISILCGICLLLSACNEVAPSPAEVTDKPPAATQTDQSPRPTRRPPRPTLTPRNAAPLPTFTPTTQAADQPAAGDGNLLTIDYRQQGEAVWDAFITADGTHLIVFVDGDQLDIYDLVSGQTWSVAAPLEFYWAPNVFVTASEVIILDYYAHDTAPVVIWRVDLASGQAQQAASISAGDLYPIQAVLSPDGSLAAVGYNNGIINLYRTSDGGLVRSIQAHIDNVTSLTFSPDGSYLISDSWSFDSYTYVFRVSTGGLAATLSAESWEPGVVDFSPDGSLASFTEADGTHLVSTSNWAPTGVVIQGVWEGVFTCNSLGLMAASDSGYGVFSTTSGELLGMLDVYPLYCLSDGSMVTVDYLDDVVRVSLVYP